MTDFRVGTAIFPNDGDNVESPRVIVLAIVNIMVDGSEQVLLLLIVHRLEGISEITAAARFHLHKDNHIILSADDVDVTVLGMPVAL